MAVGGQKAGCLIGSMLLLLLSIALFLLMVGLGAWGVVRAQDVNPCSTANLTGVTGCEPQVTVNQMGSPDTAFLLTIDWTYWLGGATAAGLLWAIAQTFAGVTLIATIVLFDADKATPRSPGNGEEVPMTTIQPASVSEEDTDGVIEQKTITLGASAKGEFKPKPLRRLTLGAAFTLFFSLLFFAGAVICLLWGIAISYDHTRRDDGTIDTYITVEILTAIILPIFLFAMGVLMAAVLDFITAGAVDLRTFIPKFLPVVKFESGTDKEDVPHDYWVIEDTFYFEIPKHDHSKNNIWYSFDHSAATWFLNAIVCLGIHLAVAYFVDFTLDTQTTLESPDRCDTIDSTYQCFHAGNLTPTQCNENVTGTVHCFKFLRFGVDVDLISAVSTSFAFHLVATTAFTYLFAILKIILHIKPSKWWGLLFVSVGVLAIIGGIVLAGVWIWGYAAPQIEEILHFNIINLAQFFMVCIYILMVGLLLVVAKWWESVPVDAHKPKVKKELVHYHGSTRAEVDKAAHEHSKEIQAIT